MRSLYLVNILLAVIFNAQSQKFIYEYKFALDSTKPTEFKEELMDLVIQPKGSIFFSENEYLKDLRLNKLSENKIKSGSIDAGGLYSDFVSRIVKSYPTYNLSYYIGIAGNSYLVNDNLTPDWKISQEKKIIGDYEVQKAEANIFDRHWVAWFTTAIPIQDGPYVFHALPGLIIQIEDKKGLHSFILKGITNLEKEFVYPTNKLVESRRYNISLDELKRKNQEYHKNPSITLVNLFHRPEVINPRYYDQNGKELTEAEMFQNNNKRELQRLQKRNNSIDLPDILK